MVVLAVLLLLAVAAVVVVAVVTGLTPAVPLDWDRINLHLQVTPLEIFIAGAATLLVAELALGLSARSQRKRWATRRELKRLRRSEHTRTTAARPAATAAPAATSSTAGPRTPPTV